MRLTKETRRRLGVESLEARDVPSSWRGWSPPANSQVSGLVYIDQNADGQAQNWEWRMNGVAVTLTGRDTAGNWVSRSATTDAGGIYWFKGLPAGNYAIEVNAPGGYTAGGNTVGAFGGNPGGSTISNLNIPSGQSSGAYNFGLLTTTTPKPAPYCPPPPPQACPPPVANSQVSGLVYADENRDGRAQDWERRLQGVIVTLTGTDTAGNSISRTTTTDQGGIYWFRTLPAGTYAIQVTTPAGYTPGQSSVGAFGGNPQPNLITAIIIPTGQSSGAYNFGQLQPTPPVCEPPPPPVCEPPPPPPVQTSTIGGLVFLDLDQSGTFTDGDTRLPNVPVTITGTTTGGQEVSLATTTGADGTYNFGNLVAGTYSIAVEQPPDTLVGTSAAGMFGGAPVINGIVEIPIPAGQTSAGYDVSFIERLR